MDAIARATDIPFRPKPLGHRVKFNLQDADLYELVNHIAGMTGKRFILGPKVAARPVKVTVVAPTPVTLAEAYEAFLSILHANGMTVVPHGRFLKIVDAQGIVSDATPIYSRGAPVPEAERYITRLYRLKHVPAEEVAALLGKFKTKEGDISVHEPGQLLILTDTGANVRRMIRIIEEVDVGGAGSKMWIEPVHYGAAKDMAARINELFELGGADPAAGGGLGKVIADEQTNSLIVVGTEESYLKLLELLKRLDGEPMGDAGKVHVLPLQHAVAEELANTLTQMLSGAAKGQQPGGAVAGIFEGEIRVTADKPTNALVITASNRDYAALRLVIVQLDQPRRQVFIEAVIMDVSVDHSTNLGLSYHGGAMQDIGGPGESLIWGGLDPLTSAGQPQSVDPTNLQALALGVRGPTLEGSADMFGFSVPAFGIVLHALATSGDANVLATPHILATDNVAAEINVGENIPLQENIGGMPNLSALAGAAGTGATAANQQRMLSSMMYGGYGFSTPRQDVGTKIKVTPHINESNQVRLEIEEEISERGATTGVMGVVSITKRTANTTLVVDDQQTVVIGGLMRDAVTKSKKKIPILGDLPVLGFLFRSSTSSTRKTNLLLIMTPYVIHEQSDLRRIFERKMQERQEFLDRYFVFTDEDWEPPRDFKRANGLVEEIRQAYLRAEERIRLEEESAPVLKEHEPTEAIELPVVVKKTTTTRRRGTPRQPATPPGTAPKQPAPQQRQPRQRQPQRRTPARRPRGELESPLRINPVARSVNIERVE
jgi:general secretion pathway protein D